MADKALASFLKLLRIPKKGDEGLLLLLKKCALLPMLLTSLPGQLGVPSLLWGGTIAVGAAETKRGSGETPSSTRSPAGTKSVLLSLLQGLHTSSLALAAAARTKCGLLLLLWGTVAVKGVALNRGSCRQAATRSGAWHRASRGGALRSRCMRMAAATRIACTCRDPVWIQVEIAAEAISRRWACVRLCRQAFCTREAACFRVRRCNS